MPKLTYFGQSAFSIADDKHTVFIDPFLSGNPLSPIKPADIQACDFIVLTHAHADHFGDTIEIAKKFDATVIATWELAQFLQAREIKAHPMSAGGGYTFPFGRLKMTLAFHGCGSDPLPDGTVPPPNTPVGLLIHWQSDDQWIYHAGDTALFSDMKLIPQMTGGKQIDVACLPIGDNFTMGIEDAAIAAEWLNAKTYVPMHYNTFPVIEADPKTFAANVQKGGRECAILKPGDALGI